MARTELEAREDAESAERLRVLAAFYRNPTWKRIAADLEGRQAQFIEHLGQTGLSAEDRAMLCGKLALVQEVLLHLPLRLADDALAQRATPATGGEECPVERDHPVQYPDVL